MTFPLTSLHSGSLWAEENAAFCAKCRVRLTWLLNRLLCKLSLNKQADKKRFFIRTVMKTFVSHSSVLFFICRKVICFSLPSRQFLVILVAWSVTCPSHVFETDKPSEHGKHGGNLSMGFKSEMRHTGKEKFKVNCDPDNTENQVQRWYALSV